MSFYQLNLKPYPYIDFSSLKCIQEPQSFPKMLAILLRARMWLSKALGFLACEIYCLSGQTLKYDVSPLPKGKKEGPTFLVVMYYILFPTYLFLGK